MPEPLRANLTLAGLLAGAVVLTMSARLESSRQLTGLRIIRIDKTGLNANNDTDFGPFQMQVTAASTPEPSSVILLTVGIFGTGIACIRRRKRRRPAV